MIMCLWHEELFFPTVYNRCGLASSGMVVEIAWVKDRVLFLIAKV